MVKLSNVSKFYYNKGVVASGFSKVNLELEVGEFVVITGESGSGKSTLLNVISGLDTYEEGEMYINGEETSHYGEAEFEEYRKKYIGNIFQHFNLVNSYTVYQNVELVLLLNGYKKKEIKDKVLDIIDKVGLKKFINRKVSKLSGGQKQRVAIARALAKETSIIVADEPTGNLDSESSASVLELLHEVAKEKLVIVVTHNYEQVEKYTTRKIKMHDGKIVEDKKIIKVDSNIKAKEMFYKDMTKLNELKIGLRNTFNVFNKFILLLLVFWFLTVSVIAQYASIKSSKHDEELVGFNQAFSTTDTNRIIIKKNDLTAFTELDYENIKKIENIDIIYKNDLSLDIYTSITSDSKQFYYGRSKLVSEFNGKLTHGRMPEKENEIIIQYYSDEPTLSKNYTKVLNHEFILGEMNGFEPMDRYKVVVTGIYLYQDVITFNQNESQEPTFYGSEKFVDEVTKDRILSAIKTETTINGKKYKSEQYMSNFKVIPSKYVPRDEVYVSETFKVFCKNYNCLKKNIDIEIKDLYFTENLSVKVTKEYNIKNFHKIFKEKKYDSYYESIFVNYDQYFELLDKGYFQSSVFVKDPIKIEQTMADLENLDLTVMAIKDIIVLPFGDDIRAIGEIIKFTFIGILMISLFFIAYFVVRLILKSRNIYYSTIRILGASKKVTETLLKIELVTVTNLAYIIFLILMILVKQNIINYPYITKITKFLILRDYIIIYMILIMMSILISNRTSRKLFQKSALSTYRDEV